MPAYLAVMLSIRVLLSVGCVPRVGDGAVRLLSVLRAGFLSRPQYRPWPSPVAVDVTAFRGHICSVARRGSGDRATGKPTTARAGRPILNGVWNRALRGGCGCKQLHRQ